MSQRRRIRRNRSTPHRATCPAGTVLATARLSPPHEDFVADDETVGAFHYTLAVHAGDVSVHAVCCPGPHYRIMFTAPPERGAPFLEAVARDFAGYLAARFGGKRRFVLDDVEPLHSAGQHVQAMARIAREPHGATA